MKFSHVVNYNGVYYHAGEEVPVPEKQETLTFTEPVKVEKEVAPEPIAPKQRGGRRRKED